MKEQLNTLFKQYIHVFFQYDVAAVKTFYQTPCTLSTPDKLVVLTHDNIDEELITIFEQLTLSKLGAVKALNSSYDVITDNVVVVNIDWQLFTENETLLTEFCAIYHLIDVNGKLKIINISSQEFNQGLCLTHPFSLT